MANINDVAKAAGVSIKTVSRVMNQEPSVRPATREKVLKVVEELDYRPNLAARNLASNRAYAIACVYDNPNAYYVIDIQTGILNACKSQGYELVIRPCDAASADAEQELLTLVRQSRVAGLVLTPPFSERPRLIEKLRALDVEVVGLEAGRAPRDGAVVIDDYQAACQITQYLVDLGHRRIGHIGGAPEHHSSLERLQGYRDTLACNGLEAPGKWQVEGDYSFDSGVRAGKQLLDLPAPPTAIFASNDEMAAGALFQARAKGIAVPEQLSIIGFEDSPFSRQTWPTLTTVNQPNRRIAEQAANLLLAKIRRQDPPAGDTLFTPKLLVRESTARAKES